MALTALMICTWLGYSKEERSYRLEMILEYEAGIEVPRGLVSKLALVSYVRLMQIWESRTIMTVFLIIGMAEGLLRRRHDPARGFRQNMALSSIAAVFGILALLTFSLLYSDFLPKFQVFGGLCLCCAWIGYSSVVGFPKSV